MHKTRFYIEKHAVQPLQQLIRQSCHILETASWICPPKNSLVRIARAVVDRMHATESRVQTNSPSSRGRRGRESTSLPARLPAASPHASRPSFDVFSVFLQQPLIKSKTQYSDLLKRAKRSILWIQLSREVGVKPILCSFVIQFRATAIPLLFCHHESRIWKLEHRKCIRGRSLEIHI